MNSNNIVECMFFGQRFNEKPSKMETGYIQKNITIANITIENLAEALVNGASFRPSILIGGRTKDDWKRQQLFGLDFDSGVSIDASYNKAISLGLIPVFMYTTFSHTSEHHKYRMIFCTDKVITDMALRDKFQATLMGLMGDIDKVCFNRDRLFFGGKGKEILFPNFNAKLNVEEIIDKYWKDEFEVYIKGQTKSKKRKLKKTTEPKQNNSFTVINYEPDIDEIPYASYPVRCVTLGNLRCLKKYYDSIIWAEGMHRERFIFIYYNCVKLLYGSDRAYKECIELNNGMEEPLTAYELKSAIIHTDEHMENKDWYRKALHGDGCFIFRPETIISDKWLNIDEETAIKCGFFDNKIRKEKIEENKKLDTLRDKEVARLYLSGLGYKKIVNSLSKEYKCSASTVKRTIERLGIKERNISLEDIEFNENKKYAKHSFGVPKVTKLEKEVFKVKSKKEISDNKEDNIVFLNEDCKRLYETSKNAWSESNINEQEIAIETILNNPTVNYCLKGKAGTGKSYCINSLLQRLTEEERKKTLVVAPTGVAASNITYTTAHTIHSIFELYTFVQRQDEHIRIPKILLNVDRIIIDEIGMVRKDVFNQLVRIINNAQKLTGNKIQLILAGDFGQISPVVTKEDKTVMDIYYKGSEDKYFCFDSPLWDSLDIHTIVLRNNHRHNNDDCDELQKEFINICDEIKFGAISGLKWLNNNLKHTAIEDGIYLCANNKQVDVYNKMYTDKFTDKKTYNAVCFGITSERKLPVKLSLELAVGMKIMTLVNTKKYKNGSLGVITKLYKDKIKVKLDNTGKEITVKYTEFKINEETDEVLYQLPIAIAYAITVNKAQGLTLEKVNIVPGFFAAGQLYTAITRIKNVHNISIIGELKETDLVVDTRALSFIA